MKINKHHDDQTIAEIIETAVDAVTKRHYDRGADETFIECLACGGWDEHKDGCPLPAMTAWLNAADGTADTCEVCGDSTDTLERFHLAGGRVFCGPVCRDCNTCPECGQELVIVDPDGPNPSMACGCDRCPRCGSRPGEGATPGCPDCGPDTVNDYTDRADRERN